jgi:protein-S-isoprenylcysteine O-methyltransferase Ste14
VLAALFFAFRPMYPRGSERLDNWLDLLAVVTALAGQSLRAAVIGYAYIRRGGKDRRVYADTLVTDGFFRHSRNPLYLGNLLVLAGLFMIHNNLWVYAIGVPFFLFAYGSIVATEEAFLRAKFGAEYEQYARRVNRWLPNLRGLRESLKDMRFAWRRVVLKEYGSTYAWTASALALMAYDTLTYFRYGQRQSYLNVLALLLVFVTIGWGVARYLKKSRRLVAD